MSSDQIMSTPWHLVVISLLGAVLYALAKPYFRGIGGKMGLLAFVATGLWLVMRLFV
jgi:uncharacterized membrane protein